MAGGLDPRIPVSVGELVDKMTILDLKRERIVDAVKLAHICDELALLRTIFAEVLPTPPARLAELTAELSRANQAIWDVEEGVRRCEARGDFGPEFIEMARAVYRWNDRRAALKRAINELCGSRIIEEKSHPLEWIALDGQTTA